MTDPLGVSKMTTTATDFQGRKPAIGKRRAGIAGLIALLGFSFANPAQAENVLEDLTYTAQPGGRVEVTMRFAEPVTVPQACRGLTALHESAEEVELLDDVARWPLLLLDHAFVDKSLQPRLGLGSGHVQRRGNLGVLHRRLQQQLDHAPDSRKQRVCWC